MDQQTQTLIINIALAGALFAFLQYALPRLRAGGVPFVDPSAAKTALDDGQDPVIIDVRTPGEFTGNLGHVPGALNLPTGDLKAKLSAAGGELSELRSHPVFVMCRTHNRSPAAARALKQAGFTQVAIIKGGMARWNREGLPVEGGG